MLWLTESPSLRRLARWIAALLPTVLLALSSCASSLLAPSARLRAESAAAEPLGEDHEGDDEGDETDAPTDVAVLPGEFEPVDRVLFGWHAGNWQYVRFFARYLRHVTPDAKVLIAVEDERERTILSASLAAEGVDLTRVDFVIHELDSMWIRDYGPVLVRTRDGGFRVMDLPYHLDRENDDAFPSRFAHEEQLPVTRPPLEMEGGHIQSDGAGRCVVTDDVLARNRLYDYTEDDVRRVLRQYFGCRHVAIVPALFAEETGHVDVFAYVTGPARVIVGSYTPEQDLVNSRRLNRTARLLRDAGFEVTRIPMPDNRHRRVFRTYTNVLVLNHTVLVPTFRQERQHERRALRAFADAFPGRRIVPIASDGVMGLAGALHCTAIAVPSLRPPALARARRSRAAVPQRRG